MKEVKNKNTIEAPEVTERYQTLVDLGKNIFTDSTVVREEEVRHEDVATARRFMASGITATSPEVWADYFAHVVIAPELGRRLATEMEKNSNPIDADKIEFLLWLHEAGRLITPSAYFRNDIIDDVLLKQIGLTDSVTDDLPSLARLIKTAEDMGLSEAQVHKNAPLNKHQETIARGYFDSMTEVQRLINLADNLGKRDENGLFSVESFLKYLRTQETRYEHRSSWPSVNWAIEHRQEGSILQAHVIKETIGWLTKMGVDVQSVLDSMTDYAPKIVILARHGEPDNKRGIVYNRDEVMKPEDIISISSHGKEQTRELGKVIKKRRFNITRVEESTQRRVKQSSLCMNESLRLPDDIFHRDNEMLNDVYAPGPYLEGLTMREWVEMKANAYDPRWQKYHHEAKEVVASRGNEAINAAAGKIKVGEAALLVSHGDFIAWARYAYFGEPLPDPMKLRDENYPNQGEAIVFIVAPDGKPFTFYKLRDQNLVAGKSY